MKAKLYVTKTFVAGTTLKDPDSPDMGNMALHVCEKPEEILTNRKELAQFLGTDLKNFVCANQTHSANFHKVTAADKGRGATVQASAIADTDALYTFEQNVVLCSLTADCVPVFFYDETMGVFGVIHSGWQGTVKEITPAVLKQIIEVEGCKPENLHIHLGPALSQEKFEVDEDVFVKFRQLGYADEFIYFKPESGKYHIDNQLTVKKQCELAGVPTEQITLDRTCTFQNPACFSYRQDRKSGRHLHFIMKK